MTAEKVNTKIVCVCVHVYRRRERGREGEVQVKVCISWQVRDTHGAKWMDAVCTHQKLGPRVSRTIVGINAKFDVFVIWPMHGTIGRLCPFRFQFSDPQAS